MKEYAQTLKKWLKLAQPNKLLFFVDFLLVVLSQVIIYVIVPIFTAKVTVAITNSAFTATILFLGLVLVSYFLKDIFWHLNYTLYIPLHKSIYKRISNIFITKMLKAKNTNFDRVSKERIINTVHTDVNTIADFADRITTACGRIFAVVISLIIIFQTNTFACLIVLIADVLDFVLMVFFQKKRQFWVKKIREVHDVQYEKFTEIIDKREAIQDLGQEKRITKEYNEIIDTYISRQKKKIFWDSMIANGYECFYQVLIFLATILCVLFVSKGSLELAAYFTVAAYISNGITNTKDLYNSTTYFNDTEVAMQRVNSILDFVDRAEVSVGKNNFKDIMGSISFNNVCYKKDDEGNPSLKNVSILLREKETTLLIGSKSCGKRTIFNMLRRTIKPTSGDLLIDGVSILDYNAKTYRNIFGYVSTQPVFFKGSIIKNLTIQEKNRKLAIEICKELGIYNYIQSLPKKFNTNIVDLPFDKLYILGLARAIISGSQVLVIYEFPTNLSDKERDNIKKLLKSMQGTRTIVIFSAKEYCTDISDKIVYIEGGEVKNVVYNEKADII